MAKTSIEILQEYIPKYLWEVINFPEGTIITNEEYNQRWNLNVTQGDYHAMVIEAIINLMTLEGIGDLLVDGVPLSDILQELYDLILGGQALGPVASMDFYTDGFTVTYVTDAVVKDYRYGVDAYGNVNEIVNVTDNKVVAVNWHNVPR